MTGSIVGLFVSPNGGVPKFPHPEIVVQPSGCLDDKQNDTKHHGGPSRAVCILCEEVLHKLQNEGHPIYEGSTGENILIRGIDWKSLGIGSVLSTSTLSVRITAAATPCRTIQDSFLNGDFSQLSHQKFNNQTRWYAEVLDPGVLRIGMDVEVSNFS